MPPWVELAGTKKKQGPRSVSFHTEMSSGNGIQKINALSCGIFLTGVSIKVNISAYSQFRIGLKWMFGNIFILKTSQSLNFIIHTIAKLLNAMERYFQHRLG